MTASVSSAGEVAARDKKGENSHDDRTNIDHLLS